MEKLYDIGDFILTDKHLSPVVCKTKTLIEYLGKEPVQYVAFNNENKVEALDKTDKGYAVYYTFTQGETWFLDRTYNIHDDLPAHFRYTRAEY